MSVPVDRETEAGARGGRGETLESAPNGFVPPIATVPSRSDRSADDDPQRTSRVAIGVVAALLFLAVEFGRPVGVLERQFGDTEREQQAIHASFAVATELVYDTFSRETHVISHAGATVRVVDDWRVYGYDAGWDSPGVVLELGKTSLDQLVVVDAFYETGSHIEDAIEWLADRPSGVIYCEHEPAHIDQLERAGFDAETAVKNIDEGIAEVRKRLEADGNLEVSTELRPKKRTVWEPIMGLPDSSRSRSRRFQSDSTETETTESDSSEPDTGEPAVGLLVSERCQELIREFYSYKEDHVGGPNADDHCLDALRYAVMGVATPDR